MREAMQKNNLSRRTILLVLAFAAVYILWGSTYLAIKYAIETLPTFLMAGARFTISGAILLAVARFSEDYEKPTLAQWKTSFIVGTLLLLGGNGGVVFAEHYISSSLAALLVATEPFWIVLLGWLWLKNERPNWKVALGLLIGFAGVYLLISGQSGDSGGSDSNQTFGTFLVVGAAFCWAVGSIYGLRSPVSKSSIMASGMQMFAGGTILFLVGTLTGEWSNFSFAQVTASSWFGLVYLIVFGSLIAFTAYSWLLKNAQPAMVATYAYVNPVIAVILGWAIAGESFAAKTLIGAGIVVGSVVLITSHKKEKKDEPAKPEINSSECQAVSASA